MLSFIQKILEKPFIAIAYTLFLLYVCLMPSENIPNEVDDKLAHFLAFAGVSFLWLWVSQKYIRVLLVSLLFGLLIEVLQALMPTSFYRSFEWADVLADSIGVVLGVILFLIAQKILKGIRQ